MNMIGQYDLRQVAGVLRLRGQHIPQALHRRHAGRHVVPCQTPAPCRPAGGGRRFSTLHHTRVQESTVGICVGVR